MTIIKDKFILAYMDVADRFSKLSTAKRLQVGAIVVKDDRIISIGYNGNLLRVQKPAKALQCFVLMHPALIVLN